MCFDNRLAEFEIESSFVSAKKIFGYVRVCVTLLMRSERCVSREGEESGCFQIYVAKKGCGSLSLLLSLSLLSLFDFTPSVRRHFLYFDFVCRGLNFCFLRLD